MGGFCTKWHTVNPEIPTLVVKAFRMQVIFVHDNLAVVSHGQITDSIYPGTQRSCSHPGSSTLNDRVSTVTMKQTGLLGWLKKEPDLSQPRRPWLPDPNEADSGNGRAFIAANAAVETVLDEEETTSGKKCGSYHRYDAKVRAKIAKLAEEHGVGKAAQLAAKELGHNVTKSSVQSMRNAYRKHIASAQLDPQAVVALPAKQRGRPLYLGSDLDSKVIAYLHAVRESGCVVNRKIAMACALGIVKEFYAPVNFSMHVILVQPGSCTKIT